MPPSPEPALEARLRRRFFLIPAITFFTTALLFAALGACLFLFRHDFTITSVVLAGLLGHSLMVVGVHDGAHRAITRTRFDRFYCSIVAGFLILPFYGEVFRRYHLLHHKYVNGPHDPLYLPAKAKFFRKNRLLYMLLDIIPMMLGLLNNQAATAPGIEVLPIGRRYVAAGLLASGLVLFFVRPPVVFVAASIVSMYVWSTIRDWCEHFGTAEGRLANAYWFPLGMGIGNHEAHHQWPSYSWLTMALGLRKRKLDTNPLKAAWQMATNPHFRHYTKTEEQSGHRPRCAESQILREDAPTNRLTSKP